MWWIKIALVVGILGGVAFHFKIDRDRTEELGAAKSTISQYARDVASKDAEIAALNVRITATNERLLLDVQRAREWLAQADAEADAARADRKRMEEQLAEARRKYNEAVNTDENLRTYRSTGVPRPVLERLRAANGEAVD